MSVFELSATDNCGRHVAVSTSFNCHYIKSGLGQFRSTRNPVFQALFAASRPRISSKTRRLERTRSTQKKIVTLGSYLLGNRTYAITHDVNKLGTNLRH